MIYCLQADQLAADRKSATPARPDVFFTAEETEARESGSRNGFSKFSEGITQPIPYPQHNAVGLTNFSTLAPQSPSSHPAVTLSKNFKSLASGR